MERRRGHNNSSDGDNHTKNNVTNGSGYDPEKDILVLNLDIRARPTPAAACFHADRSYRS